MSVRRAAIFRPAGLRTSGYYAAVFAAFGVHLPFWPLWLENHGLSAAQIGLFSAAGMGARVVSGILIPSLADRWDARRATLLGLALAGAVAAGGHMIAPNLGWLMAATLLLSAAFSGLVPVGDALGAAAARVHGFQYGQARGIGSFSFLMVNLGIGALAAAAGIWVAPPALIVFFLWAGIMGYTHPGGGRAKALVRPTRGELRRLAASPMFLLFVAAIGFSQSSHGVYYAYGSVRWRELGLPEWEIGALWAFGVAVEVVLMTIYGGKLIARLGAAGAIAISGAAGAVRWSVMALDPLGPGLWALQSLHALSFAAGHLGAIAFIQAAAPERLAAGAQGIFGAVAGGLLIAAAMAGASALYPLVGGATYLLAAAMSATGFCFAMVLRRRWDGGPAIR